MSKCKNPDNWNRNPQIRWKKKPIPNPILATLSIYPLFNVMVVDRPPESGRATSLHLSHHMWIRFEPWIFHFEPWFEQPEALARAMFLCCLTREFQQFSGEFHWYQTVYSFYSNPRIILKWHNLFMNTFSRVWASPVSFLRDFCRCIAIRCCYFEPA